LSYRRARRKLATRQQFIKHPTNRPGAPARYLVTPKANTVREPWESGDLLLVDNVRTAHARDPFESPRDIVVGMADPVRLPK